MYCHVVRRDDGYRRRVFQCLCDFVCVSSDARTLDWVFGLLTASATTAAAMMMMLMC